MKGGPILSYIITSKTYALFPQKYHTKIIEEEKVVSDPHSINNIITYNCYIYGSSLEGRKKGSSYLIGSKYKPPIIINESDCIILIPTHSTRNKSCIWFNLAGILNYYPKGSKQVVIEFKNNQKIIADVSYYVFDKQVLLASRLETVVRSRNN